ncbi:hypothetical protein GA0115233_101286 [Streptomyces sp. DI166]|uniref:hypothetical protein n=1 Tax=unclassified Streptomyces TaxID=2593676 RepID=UPI0007F3F2AA|nr:MULTISPECIES: hypothetical protein [unclassified Streptomyces]SBT89832.1 hypothetical protein GA0115233_101286 [Streptomyces sp. DI166]
MGLVVLAVLLALVVLGCVCVVWTGRGTAPRWARVAAAVTRGAGELLYVLMKSNRRSSRSGSSNSSDSDD